MKIIGIVLLALQVFALFGSIVNGSISSLFDLSSAANLFRLLGYFLPAIIGVILIRKADKKK